MYQRTSNSNYKRWNKLGSISIKCTISSKELLDWGCINCPMFYQRIKEKDAKDTVVINCSSARYLSINHSLPPGN